MSDKELDERIQMVEKLSPEETMTLLEYMLYLQNEERKSRLSMYREWYQWYGNDKKLLMRFMVIVIGLVVLVILQTIHVILESAM